MAAGKDGRTGAGKWMLIAVLFAATSAQADQRLDEAMATSERTTAASRDSQKRVDKLSDATRELLEAYRSELWKAQQLQLYMRQLDATITEQERRKEELQAQIRQIEETRQALVPMLVRMVDALEQFVELDLPFLLEERRERVARLRKVLADPELPVSEQYQRVLGAFQVEADYGRSLEAWRGALEQGRESRLVDYLRVGRTALYYLSLDRGTGGIWNRARGRWDELPAASLAALKRGVHVAREQAAPELLPLPLAELMP